VEVITRFPRAVREIVNTEITLSDGTRLASPDLVAGRRRQQNRSGHPWSNLPYRKRDWHLERDALTHSLLCRPWLRLCTCC
jgi:hypothetical protein